MPKLQKVKALQHLDTFRVLVEDTDPSSFYFQLRELDDTLHAGKNAFLVGGTEFLEPTTEVLVELVDFNGRSIFNQPIKNYAEGRARVVSVEIYEDTPPGPATLTILGELRSLRNGSPIPSEFQNVFNVRFTKRLTIDPGRFNTSPVRLFAQPTLDVVESLVPYRIAVTGSVIMVSSGTVAGFSQRPSVDNATGLSNTYAIEVDQPLFSASMVGASFTASVLSGFFTSTLASVLNDRIAYLADSYESGGLFLPFLTSNYTLSFVPSPTFVATQYTRSYADLTLGPLTTFSGEVRRTRLFMKSLDSFGDYEPVGNVFVEPTDLMTVTTGETADPEIHIGQFLNQRIFDTYWDAHELDPTGQVSTPVVVSYQTARLMDAVHVSTHYTFVINSSGSYVVTSGGDFVVAAVFGAESGSPSRFVFDANIPRNFKEGYEYMVDAVFLCRKIVGLEASVNIYLSGSAFPSQNPLGVLVKTLEVPVQNTQRYFSLQDVAANVLARADGDGVVNILVTGGDWFIQNVSTTLANERGFNPDEVHLLVPIKNKRLENLQFKAELYDLNNNAVPVTIESEPTFFVGENIFAQGRDDRIVGTITLAVSGSGPSLAVDNSGSFIGISSQSIAKPVAPTALAAYSGSPIVTIYSGTIPFIDSPLGPAVGLQIMGGGLTGSFLDFNTLTGLLSLRGDITLLPNSQLSQSIISGSSGSAAAGNLALSQIQSLVSGTFIGGTFISANEIISPLIAGNTGYFTTQFGVGNISGGSGIVLTALGYTASNGMPQSGSPAIYIGQGTFANQNTPFLVASSSLGPVFSLADRLIATFSNGEFEIIISSSNFSLSASNLGSTLLINTEQIQIGNPVPTSFTGSDSPGAIGFFVNRSGQLFLGSGSVIVSGTGIGSWISFDGENLNIQTPGLSIAGGTASFNGTIIADSLVVQGPISAEGQRELIGTINASTVTSAPDVSASDPSTIGHLELDRGDFILYGWTPEVSESAAASQSVIVGNFSVTTGTGSLTPQSTSFSNIGGATVSGTSTAFVSATVKPSASIVIAGNAAYNNVYSIIGQMHMLGGFEVAGGLFSSAQGKATLEVSFNGGTTWAEITTLTSFGVGAVSTFDQVTNFNYGFHPSTPDVSFLVRLVYWAKRQVSPGSCSLVVTDNAGEQPVAWQASVAGGAITHRRGIQVLAQISGSSLMPSFNIQASPSGTDETASFLGGGDVWLEQTGSATGSTMYFFNGSNKVKLG